MGHCEVTNSTKNTKKNYALLSIFWCYVLPDNGPFQPKHVVNKFLCIHKHS